MDLQYAQKLAAGHLLDGEEVIDAGEWYNGYGVTYLAVYTNQDVKLLFDLYTHTYLRTEEV